MYKTSVYTLVNGNIEELAHRKQQKSQFSSTFTHSQCDADNITNSKNHKRWYWPYRENPAQDLLSLDHPNFRALYIMWLPYIAIAFSFFCDLVL